MRRNLKHLKPTKARFEYRYLGPSDPSPPKLYETLLPNNPIQVLSDTQSERVVQSDLNIQKDIGKITKSGRNMKFTSNNEEFACITVSDEVFVKKKVTLIKIKDSEFPN